jgi:hypothetical protein
VERFATQAHVAGEPPPSGVQYPNTARMPPVGASPVLGELMDRVDVEISWLTPTGARRPGLAALCNLRYGEVVHARLSVIEDAGVALFSPFYVVLVLWLMIILLCFGLIAPNNGLSLMIILLSAISLSSVIFIILDLSRPYVGYFAISSSALRGALNGMLGVSAQPQ